ncbi:tol-pal system YbgF family protein [Prosthecobacter sp.]|uniref:tol-pal system YbgF family protein n=1 Tax=Prosthecobacter sp. TaxID=1965333 RepID=UPI003784F62A
MSQVASEGSVLAHLEQPKDKKAGASTPELILFAKGPGTARLTFDTVAPLSTDAATQTQSLELPEVPLAGVLKLELPPSALLLPGTACEHSGNLVTAAFDHQSVQNTDPFTNTKVRSLRLRWLSPGASGMPSQWGRSSTVPRVTVAVTESTVSSLLQIEVGASSQTSREVELVWPLTGTGTQVSDVTGPSVQRWRQDGRNLKITLLQDGESHQVRVALRRSINSIAEAGELPLLTLNPPQRALASVQLAADIDLLDLQNAQQIPTPGQPAAQPASSFAFMLGVDQPRLVLRTSKPRIESDVDVIARIDKDSVQIERRLTLTSDRPVTEVKVTLPPGEEFIAILSTPMKGTANETTGRIEYENTSRLATGSTSQQLLTTNNVSTAPPPERLITSNLVNNPPSSFITPNIISQPVFSERVIVSNGAAQSQAQAQTAGAQPLFPLTWRRVGQTIAILPAIPISPANTLEFSITSRLKLTKAWTGPKNPETITLHQLDIPDAVKVAGYTALDFDDAWRVALKEAKGLEDRDARLTPVKGRMAWFGLREHSLTFEVERAEAVFSTEVTAYALPRARTIEIEGQFALDISGAPLRTFQVKLPVENAKLLRVTSPLVGEQQLDEATGTWTYTLRQESKGHQNIRWRMSLPSTGGIPAPSAAATPRTGGIPAPSDAGTPARNPNAPATPPSDAGTPARTPDTQNAATPTALTALTATLPHLSLPQSRRFSGTWIIEANTDTQLSTQVQNMQPLDVLRVPVVAGYQPRHRVTSAFTYGAGENALTLSARRHAHSEIAALVVNRMNLTSVLDTDGHSLHQASLDLSHSGEQFVSLHLPQGAELISTSSGGQAVKPVRSVENAIAIPLPAGSANTPHTLVSVQYRQHNTPWNPSGTQNLEPIRLVGNVPVLSTDWAVYAPSTYGYAQVDTTLSQSHLLNEAREPGLMPRLAHMLGKPFERLFERSRRYEQVNFSPGGGDMANREIARRYARIEDARTAMDHGDSLFAQGDYEAALSSYKNAVNSLPTSPLTKDWLDLANLKFADCSVTLAREHAKKGQMDDARRILHDAIQAKPDHKGAKTMLQQLDDPDRWPPALTAEHITNVTKVQSGLLLANSSVELGNYDVAISQYMDVLRTDPYNTAARRGIDNAEQKRYEYFKTAYDHQRAKMLAQVGETWEDKLPGKDRESSALTDKMNRIIFPAVSFQDTSLADAVEFLRLKSRDLDTFTATPGSKGVPIEVRTNAATASARITLDLKDVPMTEVLRYVTELSNTKYIVESNHLLILPAAEYDSEVITRTFLVPPNFLTSGGGKPQSAQQVLEASGVPFPQGASAVFNPARSQLTVHNTRANLALVEAISQSLLAPPPPPPPPLDPRGSSVSFDYGVGRSPGAYLTEKMDKIIFPTLKFQDASVEDAIEYLRVKSRDLDTFTGADGVKGINLILRTGDTPSNARITLDLKDVPMREALRYVTELAQMRYKVEPHAVLITPITENASEQYTRSYRVPSDFLVKLGSMTTQATAPPADPFAPSKPSANASGATARPNARQGLEASGIPFPEGAAASYNPATSQLVVRNTQPNLDLVDQLVESLGAPPPLPVEGFSYSYGTARSPGAYLTDKMNKIILPSVQLQGATIQQALAYLQLKARELDSFTDSSGTKGVNLILKSGEAPSNASISLDLKNVPFSEALRYVTELAQMKYKTEAHAVVIVPLSENSSELLTRVFSVPRNFLDASGTRYKTARQVLESAGIIFPEGSSAIYSATSLSRLVVRNTQSNLDLVEAYLQALAQTAQGGGMPDESAPGPLLPSVVDEMLSKTGLIPLDIVLPENGRLLRFHGAQPPETLALHYTSWSRQMLHAVLAMALGMGLFWRLGRRRPWFLTLLVLILILWAAPLFLQGPALALANALTFGWLSALLLHSLGRLFALSPSDSATDEDTGSRRGFLRSFIIRHSGFVIPLFLTPSLFSQVPDPAAHTVIIPYDVKLPPDHQTPQRFYLGYDEFQRLWKLAKENRRALPPETDSTHQAVIHSALYQGRIEERGLVLQARLTATSRGDWTKLPLPFSSSGTQALVGEVRVDGKSAALSSGELTLEHPGTHLIELTATLPLSEDWTDLTLTLPPSLSSILSLHTPKSDGWLRINDAPAASVEEQPSGRLFTQTLGSHQELHLQRSSRGLDRGEGPVPAATVHGTVTLSELSPETFNADIDFEFPGAVRHTLEFAIDENSLDIGSLTLTDSAKVPLPILTTQTRRENGRLIFTLTLRHEVSHGATLHIAGAQRYLPPSGTRTLPQLHPLAQRVKQDISLRHDDSTKIKVTPGSAQRSASTNSGSFQDAGRWQWTGPNAPTYDVQPAALYAEADVSYVFQLTEQKAELLAALTLKRKRGSWSRAVIGLPAGYEVQAVQGPALTAWQHEGSQLYLQLNPALTGPEARLVVHLAKVSPQPVTTWTLEPLRLENYEKIGGKALIVSHAATDVKLPNPTQSNTLRELDPTALDSVFAIAPPMEKKRALQHEGSSWKVDVSLTRQASRFSADAVLLVLTSDAGIRVSQQVVALVEQGAVRSLSIRLPATLPEAVVSGPLLRETRSHIDGADRIYECSLQTEVLDRAELTFDLDLPLTAELDVPFVKVPDASRLSRWFVLDNSSSRESRITTQTALETVAREAVPYLPDGLARPEFFRATGDGALKLSYQQLTSTEGNAALITLADLTTVLRPDGTRWDIAQYSLINRSLQFLPVLLPDHAELISVSVSGEPVRADEEMQNGRRVRLIPLIHTRPGQRALEVKMIYRFTQGGGLKHTEKLDDPEVMGLSVERTTWTVWTPSGWELKNSSGNMTATSSDGREMEQLQGMLSELGEANRALSSGKLEYGDAESAYRNANALAEKVQEMKRTLVSRTGRESSDMPRQGQVVDTEVRQQQELLKGNWDNNYASKKAREGERSSTQIERGKTSWGMNNAAPQEQPAKLAYNNTFSGSVTTNGAQLFNDNVAVDNGYFANGAQVPLTINSGTLVLNGDKASANQPAQGHGEVSPQAWTKNATGSVNLVNRNARSNSLSQVASAAEPAPPPNDSTFRGGKEREAPRPEMKPSMSAPQPGGMPPPPAMGSDPFGAPPPAPGLPTPLLPPVMGSDPFGAPAPAASPAPMAADPFAAAGPGAALKAAGSNVAKAAPVDDLSSAPPVTLAQTVESLRPTGRRALDIDLPLDGTAHHFSKLKDHAVLEVSIKRIGDPKTTTRLLYLSGGLLLWLGIGWKLKQRRL